MTTPPTGTAATSDLAAALAQARDRLVATHRDKNGRAVVQKYSEDMDRLLSSHARAVVAEQPAWRGVRERLCMIATGGFGRRELNLHSDVDLLFVLRGEPTEEDEAFIKAFLYPLWSLRLDLGYSVKTLAQILAEVGTDLDLTTSLLDIHDIFGSKPLYEELRNRVRLLITLRHREAIEKELLDRLEQRHARYSNTHLLLEPHVKEAPGALRDIHMMAWMAYIHFGEEGIAGLAGKGLLSGREERQLRRAHAFVLELRNAMHLLDNRKSDILNIERQIRVAPEMGLKNEEGLLPEEALMRAYYDHAGVVERLLRRVLRLGRASSAPTAAAARRLAMRARRVEGIFWSREGDLWLDAKDAPAVARDPSWMMQFFAAAALHNLQPDDATLDLVTANLADVTDELRRAPAMRDRFLMILGNRRAGARILRAMHLCGFLGAYLPEFNLVRNLPRIDYYHQFTVDEHLLRSTECANDLFRKDPTNGKRHVASVAQEVLRWDLLVFALLLHDVGKGEGRGHVIRGAHLIQRLAERLDLSRKESQILHDLVLNHQKMSRLALKRNPEDPQVPRDLAKDAGNPEMLRMLYVLTCCDLQAVSDESWNEWRGMLLAQLYERTMDLLLGRDPAARNQAPSEEGVTRAVLENWSLDDTKSDAETLRRFVERQLADLPTRYRHATPAPIIARHLKLARSLSDSMRVGWELERTEEGNMTFLHVVARDSPGLFCNLCGALASRRANILSAQIYTATNGLCIDVFQLQDGGASGGQVDEESLGRLFDKLNRILSGDKEVDWSSQLPRATASISAARLESRPPTVLVTNDDSPEGHTIIEVRAPDRPGLLYAITSVFHRFRINIHLALVATESYQVVDVFYVSDWENNRLEPGPPTENLRKELLAAVSPAPSQVTGGGG